MFGLGQKHASRVGLKPVKALFSIQIVSVTLPRSAPVLDQAVLSVCFERGGKISSTTNVVYDKPAFVREVVVEFEQKVELMATLYKDFKTGRYQEKKGVLIFRELTKNNRFGHDSYKGWGRCNVNLHDLLNEMGFERTHSKEATWKFDLLNGSILKVKITSTIMSTGKDADSMSVASYMTEGSEFSTMAASFSHYATNPNTPATTKGNTSTLPSQADESDGEHSPRGRSDSEDTGHFDADTTQGLTRKQSGIEEPLQISPRAYTGYLSNIFGSADAAPASARSGASFKPNQDVIVESPPDKRRNYDLSDSDDAHSHSDHEDMKQERIEQQEETRRDSSSSAQSFQDARSHSDRGHSPGESAKAPRSHTFALQQPQVSGSTVSPVPMGSPVQSASVKHRLRDLIGHRKGNLTSPNQTDRDNNDDDESDAGNVSVVSGSVRSSQKSPVPQFSRFRSPSDAPQLLDSTSPGSTISSKSSPRVDAEGKINKKGFFSRVMKPLKPSSSQQGQPVVPALKVGGYESSPDRFVPSQPNSAITCSSEASKEAFALYDQELRRRGDHVALLERRLAEQSAQMSAQTAALRNELAATELALRREKVARAALTEVTQKGDNRLAAALSEARDEAASAMAESERLQREMRVLCGELQESREHESRLRRGQDGEMQMMQEAAQVAATSSVLRAAAEEENTSLVQSLIEVKMQHANMCMEMEEVKRENSHLKKRMQIYAQQVASLEVKYAQSQRRNGNTTSSKSHSYDSD